MLAEIFFAEPQPRRCAGDSVLTVIQLKSSSAKPVFRNSRGDRDEAETDLPCRDRRRPVERCRPSGPCRHGVQPRRDLPGCVEPAGRCRQSPRRPRPRSSPRARTATRWSIPTAPTAPSASSTSPIPRRRSRRHRQDRRRADLGRRCRRQGAGRRQYVREQGQAVRQSDGHRSRQPGRSKRPAISADSRIRSPSARTAPSPPSPSRTSATRRSMTARSRNCRPAISRSCRSAPACPTATASRRSTSPASPPSRRRIPSRNSSPSTSRNEIAVTLQENNHIAIVDAASGKIVAHFSGRQRHAREGRHQEGRRDFLRRQRSRTSPASRMP